MSFEPREGLAAVASLPALGFFALLLAAQLTFALPLQIAHIAFGLMFTEVFLFAAPAALFARAGNFALRGFLKLGRPSLSLVVFGAGIGAANFLAAGSLQALARRLLPEGWSAGADPAHLFRGASPLEIALVIVAVGIAAPICEEIAFRGYLQTVLSARIGGPRAIGLTALLFAALHLDPVGLVARIELGVLYGVLTLWSGTLWPAVAAHAMNNLIASAGLVRLVQHGASAAEGAGTLPEALALGALGLVLTAPMLSAFRRQAAARATPERHEAHEEGDHEPRWHRARGLFLKLSLAALVSLAAFAGLGWRTAAVNYVDFGTPREAVERRVAEPLREEAARRLEEAARRTRRGEAPLAAYRELRRSLGAGAGALLERQDVDDAFARFEQAAQRQ